LTGPKSEGLYAMPEDRFTPPARAFTRSETIRFSHCDAAGIVYFPHYFDMFNGVIEDWYKAELKHDYAELVMGSRFGFPFVHIECDFKIPSMMGEVIDLTLLVERIGRSSLAIAIVCHPRRLSAVARPHGHGRDVA
jgi:4-hydroxybenzoyl-CoA thioesterase